MKKENWKVFTGGGAMDQPAKVTLVDTRCQSDALLAPVLAEGTAEQWATLVIICLTVVQHGEPGQAGYMSLVKILKALNVDVSVALADKRETLAQILDLVDSMKGAPDA